LIHSHPQALHSLLFFQEVSFTAIKKIRDKMKSPAAPIITINRIVIPISFLFQSGGTASQRIEIPKPAANPIRANGEGSCYFFFFLDPVLFLVAVFFAGVFLVFIFSSFLFKLYRRSYSSLQTRHVRSPFGHLLTLFESVMS